MTEPVTTPIKQKYPTEIIDLPSKGLFYTESSPLASGKIELKYMTAREEDILTSANLVAKGLALDMVTESIIVNKEINIKDLLIGDLNAIYIASRVLGYGKDYVCEIDCPSCGEKREISIDLTKLEEKPFIPPTRSHENEFNFELPISKLAITFKILTKGDEILIADEIKKVQRLSNSQISTDMTTRLKYIVTSVNGNRATKEIRDTVDNMLVKDTKALRDEYSRVTPNVDLTFDFKCSSCLEERKMGLPINLDFFWPKS